MNPKLVTHVSTDATGVQMEEWAFAVFRRVGCGIVDKCYIGGEVSACPLKFDDGKV